MNPDSLVIVHLVQPTEKLWGVLLRLAPEGITVRAINVSSFDDWARAVARRETSLDLVTMFVPLFRVERMFLDEQVGEVESYGQRFARLAGVTVESHLGLDGGDGAARGESGLVS
ncbi:MAG TPA: hypothetical protein VGS57_16765 [Thermoanaerobaculia bacterium]|jgi:hypothetical protein|nr:hypothetical protein [Thermoanaerobaculia bacterium]